MKTHKVDVVSGYSYPQDNHTLWFDESQNVLKKYDGTKWVSGSAVNNGDRNYEKNFYTKEEVVPEQVLWEGNLQPNINEYTGDVNAVSFVLGHLTDGQLLNITLSNGHIYETQFVYEGRTDIVDGDIHIFYADGTYWYGNKIGNESLTKISIPSTTQNILVWNYQDSLPIAMPKCIEDNDYGFVAIFDKLPEAGKAYYIPLTTASGSSRRKVFIPILITDISEDEFHKDISGECYSICNSYVVNIINGSGRVTSFCVAYNDELQKYMAWIQESNA